MKNSFETKHLSPDVQEGGENKSISIEIKKGITENIKEVFDTDINSWLNSQKTADEYKNYPVKPGGGYSYTRKLQEGISEVNPKFGIEIGIYTEDLAKNSGSDYGVGVFWVKDGKCVKNIAQTWRQASLNNPRETEIKPAIKSVENLRIEGDTAIIDIVRSDGSKFKSYLSLKES
jgi:hypothetical protein